MPQNKQTPPFRDSLASWLLYCAALAGAAAILKLTWGHGILIAGVGAVVAAVFVLLMIMFAGQVARTLANRNDR